MREKRLHDEASALGHARRERHAEGKAEGRAEERKEMLDAMRATGISEEQIQEMLRKMRDDNV